MLIENDQKAKQSPHPEKECAKITSKHVENINSTNNQRILNNSVRIFSVCVCCYFHCNSQYCHKHMETTAPHLSRNVIHLESVERQFWEIVSALWEEEYNSGDSWHNRYKTFKVHTLLENFPSGSVIENLPSNAGDMGSIPCQGTEIPHATGQLSPCPTTRGPACPNERSVPPQQRTISRN